MNSLIKYIEESDTEYSKYLWEKIKKEVPDIDACSSWIYCDGYYGPCYYDLNEEEITGTEADQVRKYCLDRISEAIEEIEDYVIYDYYWFDEDGNELDEPIEYEESRICRFAIAKELFSHVVEIYGSLP